MPKRSASACVGIPKEKCIHPCEMTNSIINEKYNHCRTKYLNVKNEVKKMKPSVTKKNAEKKISKVEEKMQKVEEIKNETTKSANTLIDMTKTVNNMLSSVLSSDTTAPEVVKTVTIPESSLIKKTVKKMKRAKKNKSAKKTKVIIPHKEIPKLEPNREITEMGEPIIVPEAPVLERGAVLNAEEPSKPLIVL